MPSRVVAIVDGVTYVQIINPGTRAKNLLDAARYLLSLCDDQELLEAQRIPVKAANG